MTSSHFWTCVLTLSWKCAEGLWTDFVVKMGSSCCEVGFWNWNFAKFSRVNSELLELKIQCFLKLIFILEWKILCFTENKTAVESQITFQLGVMRTTDCRRGSKRWSSGPHISIPPSIVSTSPPPPGGHNIEPKQCKTVNHKVQMHGHV